MADPIPAIVAGAQILQDKRDPAPKDPVALAAAAAEKAMARVGVRSLDAVCDTVVCINIMSWNYRDPAARLCELLNFSPKNKTYGPIGGNTPQAFVQQACREIAAGRSRGFLIAGGEAAASARRAKKGLVELEWPQCMEMAEFDGADRPPVDELEMVHDFFAPAYAYSFFENALRARLGRSPQEHVEALGKICEGWSAVAANNPYAWFREKRTARDITTPTANNRMVAYPYTMRMTANAYVDQGAAVLVTSEQTARDAGLDAESFVYPAGAASLNNIWNVSRRPTLYNAPALKIAADLALAQAGLTVDQVDVFDFYSCFPWAAEAACMELNVDPGDPRGLTVTGGLPYFGGPGSNFTLHAICSVLDRIQSRAAQSALVTALGWYNTKWSVGVYAAQPPVAAGWGRDDSAVQAALDSHEMPRPVARAQGEMTVEAYDICHDFTGAPEHGIVIGRLPDGSRAFAFVDGCPDDLAALSGVELVGKTGPARFEASLGKNFIKLEP